MPRCVSILLAVLALVMLGPAASAQGYRPADRWQDVERARYAACYAAHDGRMADYERQIGHVRTEMADNEFDIRRATDPATRAALLELRTELRRDIARMIAERPVVEARSTRLLRQCQKRVDLAEAKKKAVKKVTVIRSSPTRVVTTPRSSGSRYVTTGRGTGSRYVTTGRGVGGRVVVPTNRGYGSRGIGVRGIGGRGTATRCHHQPGTSQRHCGSG